MKPNLLILSSRFPFPLEKGDKLRMFYQIKDLSTKYNIYLFSMSDEIVRPEDEKQIVNFVKGYHIHYLSQFDRYKQLGLGLFKSKPLQVSYFYNKTAQKELNILIDKWNIDSIYCQLIRMSEYVTDINKFKVLDFMDSFSLGLNRRINESSIIFKPFYKMEYNRVKKYEIKQTEKFDKLFIIAENDQRSIKGSKSIELLKNGVDFNYFKPTNNQDSSLKKYDLVFVGNMQYHPNVKAAKYLVEVIKPLLEQKGFSPSILIAGANPTVDVKKLKADNVTISGWMDDIREAYWSSKIFIAPLFTGSGLQNKVLEAMASKIPVITTSIVNHSLGAKKNEMLKIGNSPSEFVDSIIYLLDTNNSNEISEMVEKSSKFISDSYGWKNNNQVLLECFNKGSKT